MPFCSPRELYPASPRPAGGAKVGGNSTSYRAPRFSVRLLRTRQESCQYTPRGRLENESFGLPIPCTIYEGIPAPYACTEFTAGKGSGNRFSGAKLYTPP